jgi:hypothetical protein
MNVRPERILNFKARCLCSADDCKESQHISIMAADNPTDIQNSEL